MNPDVSDKRIIVKIDQQTLSCMEGDTEVHFARISSGALYDAWGNRVDAWETPVGGSPIWRKSVSLPLSGGSASAGWSLPAVGWVSLFVGTGVAKWIFRSSLPQVPYDPGDVTVEWPGGTKVIVEDQVL